MSNDHNCEYKNVKILSAAEAVPCYNSGKFSFPLFPSPLSCHGSFILSTLLVSSFLCLRKFYENVLTLRKLILNICFCQVIGFLRPKFRQFSSDFIIINLMSVNILSPFFKLLVHDYVCSITVRRSPHYLSCLSVITGSGTYTFSLLVYLLIFSRVLFRWCLCIQRSYHTVGRLYYYSASTY